MPNALEVGPDGKLYYPMLGTNDIWRIDPDGGEPERVAGDLGVPGRGEVRLRGFIISTQVGTGAGAADRPPQRRQHRASPTSAPAWTTSPSSATACSCRASPGRSPRSSAAARPGRPSPDGLTWPLDLTVGPDGTLYVADGTFLLALGADGELRTAGNALQPRLARLHPRRDGRRRRRVHRRRRHGHVSRYRPATAESEMLWSAGLSTRLYGVAVSGNGAVAVADLGTGKVHSVRIRTARKCWPPGSTSRRAWHSPRAEPCLVSESGAGRVVAVTGSGTDTRRRRSRDARRASSCATESSTSSTSGPRQLIECRPGHQGSADHRPAPAGRRPARGHPQAAQGPRRRSPARRDRSPVSPPAPTARSTSPPTPKAASSRSVSRGEHPDEQRFPRSQRTHRHRVRGCAAAASARR